MIIKRLRLNNMRSYVNETVAFPSGTILFEGDVGSGKTTILLSIEFALFGLSSDLKGEHLLRAGCSKGSAELTIDVSGKELIVRRALERHNGRISQTDCYLVFEGVREDYSVSEMKARVLEILGFNERVQPQASSLIYRYAVFTPQEKMKEILLSNADERLETIRRAFMMEDYKNAVLNSEEVQKSLKSQIKAAEMFVSDADKLRQGIEAYVKEKASLTTDITKLGAAIEKERTEHEEVRNKIESLKRLREKYAAIKAEISSLEKNIMTGEKNAANATNRITAFAAGIEKINTRMKALGEKKAKTAADAESILASLKMDIKSVFNVDESSVREARKRIKSEIDNAFSESTKIRMRVQDFEKIMSQGVCPLCDRAIDAVHSKNRIDGHAAKLEEIEKLLHDRRAAETKMESLISLLLEMKNVNNESNMLAQSFTEEMARKKEADNDRERHEKSLQDAASARQALLEELSNLDEEVKGIAALEERERLHRRRIEELTNAHSAKSQRLSDVETMIGKDSERVKLMDAKLDEIKSMKESADWLRSYFTPSVETIEKHVFASYNRNFDSLIKKWFSMLMDSGEISIRVDDKFTPITEQNGYEQDIDALSGGEKTSVALAYRLALNTMVKEICMSMKNNLLILDEPTDGFSKEQLHRVRDVLDELKCNQVIIVSHEKELEAFVDSIIEVRKEGTASRIATNNILRGGQ